MDIKLFQIYYDSLTRKKIDNGFIPLDNFENTNPEWFEFLPILNYLRNNELHDNTLYGFFSTKFSEKTGFSADYIKYVVNISEASTDIFLFSHSWDQISYFINPWEQGEYWHPGITKVTQDFIDSINIKLDINNTIFDSTNTVFSNYFIANKRFWDLWKALAEKFYYFIENNNLIINTSYGDHKKLYPMKAFAQERLACMLLELFDFNVQYADSSHYGQINEKIFEINSENRLLLQTCDIMKRLYRKTEENIYLNIYWKTRNQLKLNLKK